MKEILRSMLFALRDLDRRVQAMEMDEEGRFADYSTHRVLDELEQEIQKLGTTGTT